jgi:PKD repeat protein
VAAVYDNAGNRLPGVPVSFVTDNGTLSTNSAVTDAGGDARSTLITPLAATVTATVSGGADKTLTATAKITLRAAPDVSITVTVASPVEDQPVGFVFSVKAGTGGAAVRSATVDFGDGGSQTLATNGTTTASHTYRSAGTYTVVATATDTAGETTVATASVAVAQATPLGVTLTASGAMIHQGVISFTATVTPATGVAIDHYEWSFGDGGSATTSGGATTHVYAAAGHYVITVKVVTTDGRTGTARTEIILS